VTFSNSSSLGPEGGRSERGAHWNSGRPYDRDDVDEFWVIMYPMTFSHIQRHSMARLSWGGLIPDSISRIPSCRFLALPRSVLPKNGLACNRLFLCIYGTSHSCVTIPGAPDPIELSSLEIEKGLDTVCRGS